MYWCQTSNGREWMWATSMRVWVVCHRWDHKRDFHLSGIVHWWWFYVVGKVECRSYLMSSFFDFCGLGGVRTWWCSWVHTCVRCFFPRSNWLTSTEHIRHITSSNPQSAHAVPILHSRHEYGPMNITMSLLYPVHKSQRMNSLDNFYTQLFQQHKTIINEQSQTDENPFYDLIYDIHACSWPIFILSHSQFDISTVRPTDTTSKPYLVRNILTTIFTYML